MALDQACLADVRERQVRRRVEDLDGGGGDPAMAAVSGGRCNRDVLPGQGVENVEQAGLVVLDREREVRAPAMHVVRGGALRVEGIGRYDGPVQAQAIEQRDDHRDLVRLRADLGLGCDDAPAAGQGGQQVHLLPSAFLAPRTVLPSTRTGISGIAGPLHQPGAAAASKAAVSAPVTTRQIVHFDGLCLGNVERGPDGEIWYAEACLRVPGLESRLRVSAHYALGFDDLVAFFGQLAADWRGWRGERTYESLEGDLRLAATHDGMCGSRSSSDTSQPDGGSVTAVIRLDPGEEMSHAVEGVAALLSSAP